MLKINVIVEDINWLRFLNNPNIYSNNQKEEAPIKFEIPHRLLNKHIQQAAMGLWVGLKID